MCGIGGLISSSLPFSPERVIALRDAMLHRGPDGAGLLAWDSQGHAASPDQPASCWLAHRRLSILDLSPAAAQPMSSSDGRRGLSFNGEIYNFAELRGDLQLASSGDTDVLRACLERDGVGHTVNRLNGMFAFAWMEPEAQRLTLVRDRMGQKPLYYVELPEGGVAFASELPALFAGGFADPSRQCADAVDAYWTLGYIPAPLTFYEGVRQVRPGHCLVWEKGKITETAYWQCVMGQEPQATGSIDDWADELEALLGDAIRLRMIADVPVGLFLSGGIDSTLICALAKQEAGEGVRTFTIGFEEKAYDESPAAEAVARHLGLSNQVLRADPATVAELLQVRGNMLDTFGQPLGDASILPTYLVCALAREHVTVVLTGDAGDELFAGYDDYRHGLHLWGDRHWRQSVTRRQKLTDAWYRQLGPTRGFARWAMLLGPRHRRRLFADAQTASGWAEGVRCSLGEEVNQRDPLSIMQTMDLNTYLPDDILVKLDRCSMAVSLEARSPLLDYRVVEFASRLPMAAKMNPRGQGKHLLRHLLARHVPRELWDRPKQGFAPPWRTWAQALGSPPAPTSDAWLDLQALARLEKNLDQHDERLSWSLYAWRRMC